MSLPYAEATAGERALMELQKVLAKFGCTSFGTMTDTERKVQITAFKWRGRSVQIEASWDGYAKALYKSSSRRSQQACYDQARISVCSVLRDWVKGQTTAIECGVMSFEEAWLPHMLTNNGQRVADRIKTMPALLEGPTT